MLTLIGFISVYLAYGRCNVSRRKGFTLVELLVVIAILAVLATVAVVGYLSFINNANEAKAKQELDDMVRYLNALTTANPVLVHISDNDVIYAVSKHNEQFIFTHEPDVVLKKIEDFASLSGVFGVDNGKLTYTLNGATVISDLQVMVGNSPVLDKYIVDIVKNNLQNSDYNVVIESSNTLYNLTNVEMKYGVSASWQVSNSLGMDVVINGDKIAVRQLPDKEQTLTAKAVLSLNDQFAVVEKQIIVKPQVVYFVWEKIENVSQLIDGAEIILVDEQNQYVAGDRVGSNLSALSVTIGDDLTIESLPLYASIFTLEKLQGDTWKLRNQDDKYLSENGSSWSIYWNSSRDQWKIEIDQNGAKITNTCASSHVIRCFNRFGVSNDFSYNLPQIYVKKTIEVNI